MKPPLRKKALSRHKTVDGFNRQFNALPAAKGKREMNQIQEHRTERTDDTPPVKSLKRASTVTQLVTNLVVPYKETHILQSVLESSDMIRRITTETVFNYSFS